MATNEQRGGRAGSWTTNLLLGILLAATTGIIGASVVLLALLGLKPWESYGMTDDPIAAIARGGDEVLGRLGD